jgi:hypothetical protein
MKAPALTTAMTAVEDWRRANHELADSMNPRRKSNHQP